MNYNSVYFKLDTVEIELKAFYVNKAHYKSKVISHRILLVIYLKEIIPGKPASF